VAAAAAAQGRRTVLFPLRGFADPAQYGSVDTFWLALGQLGRFVRVARQEGCRDVVLIGTVTRPRWSQLRLDFLALRMLPRVIRAFRGGDDHLLGNVAAIGAELGFNVVGAQEIAPEILMPEGSLGSFAPSARDRSDIDRALALLDALSPFDVGQAAVMADAYPIAVEAAEGTDLLLARVADLRQSGRVKVPTGVGVLVKAPKRGQDPRLDLPTIGVSTVEGVAKAGLAGIAVVARQTLVAEPQEVAAAANARGIFVTGIAPRVS
jgi:DUF1009 family protein